MKQTSLFQNAKRLFEFIALIAVIAMWCCPTIAFACSGETMDLIYHNRLIVQICAALSIVLFVTTVVLYFLRGRKGLWVVVASFMLVVFHPAWINGGGAADCGRSMSSGAKFWVVLLGIGAAHQLRSWLINRRNEIGGRI
ncbi:MAG TPA: hypothetical protein VFH91_09630 [Pyrinomonadaceae bacterium]|nr:hypothetical protein [Pyrinomonadaceae bacterium]